MKPEHKKYILEHRDKKSLEEIARDLGLKERKITKFLEQQKAKGDSLRSGIVPNARLKKGAILSVLLIILLGFAVYGNSINGTFLWDDETLVENNVYVKDWSYLPDIFAGSIGGGIGKKYNFYRPLQTISYALDYSFWKLDPRGYHLTNILLHIAAALSLYALIYALFKDGLLALLTGVLFVIHPIHTEAVTYISGRADPLALLFMLLCFTLYVKSASARNIGFFVLILLSYAAALLSKESSLILPVLLFLYHASFKKELKPKVFVATASVAAAYLLFRVTILKGELVDAASVDTFAQRLPGFFVAVATYIKLLIVPFDLHMEYGSGIFPWSDPRAIAGVVIVLSLLIFAFKKRTNDPFVFFAVMWFFITLLPVSNLYPINAYMSEHWLYLPSIGIFLLAAKTICVGATGRSPVRKVLTVIVIGCLFTFYAALTVRQNTFWREPLEFYKRTLQYAPDSSRLHNNLGVQYYVIGKNKEAIASYKKAIEIEADFEEAYYNLGVVYNALEQKEEAVEAYKKSIELKPDYALAYSNLGNVYKDLGRTDEAIASHKKAIALKADYAEAHNNLGVVYHSAGRDKEAIAAYKKAIEINPGYARAYSNLGNLYNDLNRGAEATAAFKKATALMSDDASTYNNLGVAYGSANKGEEAIAAFKKAIEIKPDFFEAHNNLGNMFGKLDRKEEAIAAYKQAVAINPQLALAHNNLGLLYNSVGRRAEAAASFEKAIVFSSENVEAHNNLGVAYAAMNKREKAIAAYEKAVQIDPEYVTAYFNLGTIYDAVGRSDEAAAAYEKVIELTPDDAEAYSNLAVIYFESKQYALAIEYCDKAKALGFVNSELIELLKPHRQ